MKRLGLIIGAAVLVVCCCAGAVLVAVFGALDSASDRSGLADCRVPAGDPAVLAGLDTDQLDNGEVIVQVGIDLQAPPRAWVIAVATAMQESALRNLAGGDRDSLGLFQQRPSQGWGSPEQLTDPVYASTVFYERLLQVQGWRDLPLTEAAQAVQRSAFPDAYARHEPLALAVVSSVAAGIGGAAGFEAGLRCAALGEVTAAGWFRPVPGPVTSGFRPAGRPTHYGIDTADGRGTVVRAAADGTVIVSTCDATLRGQPYSCDVDGSPQVAGCGWYVDLLHAGGVVTRYCHLVSRPVVTVGDRVVAGQQLGLVGTSGSSSGVHLHFEVELRSIISRDADGVTLERRQIDPVPFLAERGIVFACAGAPAGCEPAYGDRVRIEYRPG